MKYYIIAGEASGDLHGSNLIRQIRQQDPKAEIRAWGGDLMEKAGAHVVMHYRKLAFMGFVEVIANLRTILRNLEYCKKDIAAFKPDAVILVDYPGFNMRIARFASETGLRVYYYISPQVWAWKQSRVMQVKKYVHRMLVILPFEKEFYRKFDVDVDFVGHPLLDVIEKASAGNDETVKGLNSGASKIIALLPGSRKQEIKTVLPLMLSVVNDFPGYRFIVGGAPSIEPEFYSKFIRDSSVEIEFGNTYSLLSRSLAALVTSGTATLETALFRVPQVVCYKGSTISYHIARQLIKVKFISLVNLIMEEEVVTELIQDQLNSTRLKKELTEIVNDTPRRQQILESYNTLRTKLGGSGASARAASVIITDLESHKSKI